MYAGVYFFLGKQLLECLAAGHIYLIEGDLFAAKLLNA